MTLAIMVEVIFVGTQEIFKYVQILFSNILYCIDPIVVDINHIIQCIIYY